MISNELKGLNWCYF